MAYLFAVSSELATPPHAPSGPRPVALLQLPSPHLAGTLLPHHTTPRLATFSTVAPSVTLCHRIALFSVVDVNALGLVVMFATLLIVFVAPGAPISFLGFHGGYI